MDEWIWEFFSVVSVDDTESETDYVCCSKCLSHGIKKLFLKSSEKTLKKHLLEKHGILVNQIQLESSPAEDEDEEEPFNVPEDDEDLSFRVSVKRKALNSSPVWKYFIRPMKGATTADVFVYCIPCINQNTVSRYRHRSSTTTLRNHLTSRHNLDLDADAEPLTLDPTMFYQKVKEWEETVSKQRAVPEEGQRQNRFDSKARKYFGVRSTEPGHFYCLLCTKENVDHLSTKYSRTTSTSTLKRHLLNTHNFNPDTEKRIVQDPNQIEIPDEIKAEIAERLSTPTHKIWNYFIVLEGDEDEYHYCIFCLNENERRCYRKSTSATNLRTHLERRHGYILPPKPSDMSITTLSLGPELSIIEAAEDADDFFTDDIVAASLDLIEDPKHPVTQYFIQFDNGYQHCAYCIAQKVRCSFSMSTDQKVLLQHLQLKHEHYIEEEDVLMEDTPEIEYLVEEEALEVVEEHEEDEQEFVVPPLQKYCRACGKSDVSFFTKITGTSCMNEDDLVPTTLAEAYFQCTGVLVDKNDGKSQLICYPCEANLKTAFQFRKLANHTESSTQQAEYVITIPSERKHKRPKVEIDLIEQI